MQGIKSNINKELLEKLYFDDELSQRAIAKKLNLSFQTIRRWMKKFNIERRTNICGWLKATKSKKVISPDGMSWCGHCENHLTFDKFPPRRHKRNAYCTLCWKKYENSRNKVLKEKAVKHLGGCCKQCGFDKHLAALDFHHLNPLEKDMDWGKLRKCKWEIIKSELNKCVILCANCHRAEHSLY